MQSAVHWTFIFAIDVFLCKRQEGATQQYFRVKSRKSGQAGRLGVRLLLEFNSYSNIGVSSFTLFQDLIQRLSRSQASYLLNTLYFVQRKWLHSGEVQNPFIFTSISGDNR